MPNKLLAIQDVARKLMESYLEHGDPLPALLQATQPDTLVFHIPVGLPQ